MPAAATTLSAALATTDGTSLTVRDTVGFPQSGAYTILIDAEFLRVTAGAGTLTWTVTRGYAGSTGATHLNGATVTWIEELYTSLIDVRAQMKLGASDTTSDTLLTTAVQRANAFLINRIGAFLGPSTDTVRYYDVEQRCRRLYIRDGIRTQSEVAVATTTGGSYTAQTAGDVFLRPLNPLPGRPYEYIELSPSGSSLFYPGLSTAKITGTFGWATVDPDLNSLGTSIAIRLFKRGLSGEAGVVSDIDGTMSIAATLSAEEWRTIGAFRDWLVR